MGLLERLYEWLASRVAPYMILELQIGGHCGICGNWVKDVIVEQCWPWTLCKKCQKGDFD